MRKVWTLQSVDERKVKRLSQSLHVPPIIARLLLHRGASGPQEAGEFLCADLSSLPAPFAMEDNLKAVHLIRQAITQRKKILVVGDYDVDGLTGTALLVRVLKALKGKVCWYIPHRVEEGYGLKASVIRQAAASKVGLLISVDCGTTAFEELRLAREKGIQTIVVDHHELQSPGRPPADAFLNPLQPRCRYPTKGLSSVGVAFTLARGLLTVPGTEGTRNAVAVPWVPGTVFEHLDLVALGTVADHASLLGENRILVKAGLHCLSGTRKVGLRALLVRTDLAGENVTSEDVSFLLAPRLNAMGRISSAESSLRLLVTEDGQEARDLARTMDRHNRQRALLEREAFWKALAKVEREVNFARDRVIVLEDDRWHPGVVGIVATRLAIRFHRPVVVIALTKGVGRGSARLPKLGLSHIGTPPAFHWVDALEEVKEHLLEFGGHASAAGLTIDRDRIGVFKEALNQVAQKRIDPKWLTPSLDLDAELPLSALTEELMRDLEVLAPFGAGNPWPIFLSRDAHFPEGDKRQAFHPIGARYVVESSCGKRFDLLQPRYEMWRDVKFGGLKGRKVKLAYSPILRRRGDNGPRIELKLRDIAWH